MNVICLIGRIAREPELKFTAAGKAVCNFLLAVDRGFGENKTADFLPITCWDQSAEFAANHLAKGRLVSIEGRLQSRQWETNDGQKRTAYDVVAHRVEGLGPKPADTPASRQTQRGAPEPPAEAARPAPAHDPNDPFETQ